MIFISIKDLVSPELRQLLITSQPVIIMCIYVWMIYIYINVSLRHQHVYEIAAVSTQYQFVTKIKRLRTAIYFSG